MCSRWIARVRTAFSMTLGLEGARVPLGNECFAYLSGFRRTPRLSLCAFLGLVGRASTGFG